MVMRQLTRQRGSESRIEKTKIFAKSSNSSFQSRCGINVLVLPDVQPRSLESERERERERERKREIERKKKEKS